MTPSAAVGMQTCGDGGFRASAHLLPCSPYGLAITAPQAEHRVCAGFQREQIPHRIFKLRAKRVERGRVIDYERVAFPGYVFFAVHDDSIWRRVLETTGVVQIARHYYDNTPKQIAAIKVHELLQRCHAGTLPYQSQSRFRFNDRVRIVGDNNLMFGYCGVYQYPTSFGRSCVLMPWLGALREWEFDDIDIESVEAKKRKRRGGRRGRQRRVIAAQRKQLSFSA